MTKKAFLFILAVFWINQAYCQDVSTNLNVKLIENYNSIYKLQTSEVDSIYFNLKAIKSSLNNNHIRISLPGQIIDLYQNITYHGTLTNEITESDKRNEKRATIYKKIYETIPLDQKKIESVFNKIIESKQFEIPTDSLIQNWNFRFLDCNSLTFEYKLNKQFYYQKFSCISSQNDSIEFKKIIIKNVERINESFQLDSIYDAFKKRLPRGKTYTKDGYMWIFFLTEKQIKFFKKEEPIRNHLKSIKDSIDNYIQVELKRQNIKLSGIDCFETYNLVFSSKGRLINIEVSKNDKPKIKDALSFWDYLKEKKEVRKCELIIKKLFKNINLSKFKPKYKFYRTISFGNSGEFYLHDNMFY